MAKDGFNFTEIRKQITSAIKELPKEMAIEVKDESVKNIENQSFYGDRWTPAKENQDHKLLSDTGKLKSDVKKSVQAGNKGSNYYKLVVVNDYGLFHNEGTDKIPQRQFMGESSIQIKNLTDLITKALDKLWMH